MNFTLNLICRHLNVSRSHYVELPPTDWSEHRDGDIVDRSLNDILIDIYDAIPSGFTSQYTIMRCGQEPWHVFYTSSQSYWEVVGTFEEVILALANRYLESLEQ